MKESKRRVRLRKELSVFFTVDTVVTRQDSIVGFDAAGIDINPRFCQSSDELPITHGWLIFVRPMRETLLSVFLLYAQLAAPFSWVIVKIVKFVLSSCIAPTS